MVQMIIIYDEEVEIIMILASSLIHVLIGGLFYFLTFLVSKKQTIAILVHMAAAVMVEVKKLLSYLVCRFLKFKN